MGAKKNLQAPGIRKAHKMPLARFKAEKIRLSKEKRTKKTHPGCRRKTFTENPKKQTGSVRQCKPLAASQRSASKAAMHPEPAAVTA